MGKTSVLFRVLFGLGIAFLALLAGVHFIHSLIVPAHETGPSTSATLAGEKRDNAVPGENLTPSTTAMPGSNKGTTKPSAEVIMRHGDPPLRDGTYASLVAESHAESHKGLYRRLRVSPEQEAQLRGILARQDAAMGAVITRMQHEAMMHPGEKSNISGANKSEETKEIDEASEAFKEQLLDTDRRIAALLAPDQLAVYREYQNNQHVYSAEDLRCDDIMLKAPYLNVENCQRAAEVIVQEHQAYARENPSAGKPHEFLQPDGPGAGWALKRARERLAREMSADQFQILDAYLTEEQTGIANAQKIALIQKVSSWIDKLGSRVNRKSLSRTPAS